MAFTTVVASAVAQKYSSWLTPWTDAAAALFNQPPAGWTVGKHAPTNQLLIITPQSSQVGNFLQKLAPRGITEVNHTTVFDAERMGLLSFYVKPDVPAAPAEPASQPMELEDASDVEADASAMACEPAQPPDAAEMQSILDASCQLTLRPNAVWELMGGSGKDLVPLTRTSPEFVRLLIRRASGLSDFTWDVVAPMFSDELIKYRKEEALLESKPSVFDAFEWTPAVPTQLMVCSNKNMSAERRLAWTLWRAEAAGSPIEKRREHFTRFMTFFRDTSPYPSAKLFTEAVKAWALWEGPALPVRRQFSDEEQLEMKLAEGVHGCPSCNVPVFKKEFGLACSWACQRRLCKRCHQEMEPLPLEQCPFDETALAFYRSQVRVLENAQTLLRWCPRPESPEDKLHGAELRAVQSALEGCQDRQVKRRRMIKCPTCPDWWHPDARKTEEGLRYFQMMIDTQPELHVSTRYV